MSTPYILRYIAEGEHQQQDFKMRIDDPYKIARTLVSFANTDGGRILIGVKDNGSVCGVRPEEEIHMMERSSTLHCRPVVPFTFQLWKVEFRQVLEIIVAPSDARPHEAETEPGQWKAFIRREDRNLPAPSVLLEVWRTREAVIPAQYRHTEKEQRLFALLREQPSGLTFSALVRLTGIPRYLLIRLLARLVRWNLVEMDFHQDSAIYRIAGGPLH